MNANCIICSDLFQARSDTYTTSCGHIFHFICLVQWLERSKTCPQCRCKATEKTIHRVYFNVTPQEHTPDDIVTVQAKLDNEKFNFKLASKKLQNVFEDYKKCNTNSKTLVDMTVSLHKKQEENKAAMIEMKGRLHYYKDKLRDKDKCIQEVTRLRSQIENMKHLKAVIDGGKEEVDDIIGSTRDPRTQSLFVAVLQKELTEQDRKMQKLGAQLRLNKSDYNEVKAHGFVLKKKYEELMQAKEDHKSCDAKIQRLKDILSECVKTNENPNDSINRAIFENPAPMRPDFNEGFIDGDAKESPTVNQRVAQIRASDSPYLTIKSTAGNSVSHLLQAKYKVQAIGASSAAQNAGKYSIFSKKVAANSNKREYNYDGMGGHSKEEVFPKPKSGMSNSSVKRIKTTVTNSKLKKLNPKAVSAFTLLANKK